MFEIRQATEADIPIIVDNLRDAVERMYAKGNPMWNRSEVSWEWIGSHYILDHFYLAFEDGKPAGSMVLDDEEYNEDPSEENPWHTEKPGMALGVHKLIARSEFSGHGIASKLLDYAKEEGRRRGFASVRLNCYADRMPLRNLYERNGFRLVGFYSMGVKPGAFYIFEL